MSLPEKITQIMLTKGFGGAERHFVDLSLSLADRGYQIQAIHHRDFSYREKLMGHPNIVCRSVNVWGFWDWHAYWEIKRLMADFSPQIVHTHLARGAFLGGKAAASLNIPTVVNLHNYVKLKYYRNIDRFIAATADQKRYLIDNSIAESAVTVMPHFSMLVAAKPHRIHAGQPIRFVALGRLVKKKGFDVLIEAFERYLAAGKDGTLLIGGDGPEREQLLQLAAKPQLAGRIEFAGWIDDVAEFLSRGDVFVLPSRDEPFGIVVLEAMASGRPIITTRTQGPITILDESNAYFVDIGDVDTLLQAMLAVDQTRELAFTKAEAASALYQSTYSAAAVVPQVELVYAGCL